MVSTNFVTCLTKLIDNKFDYVLLNQAYKNAINTNNPSVVLESLDKAKPGIFDSLGNIQQCLPIPNEITAFVRSTKGTATPKSIIAEKYKTAFDITQCTTQFFGSGPSTLSTSFKADLCYLLKDKNFCSAHPDWSAAGILLCMIDARHSGVAFANVPSGSCEYKTACDASYFQQLIIDHDGSNSLAMQVAFELCDLF